MATSAQVATLLYTRLSYESPSQLYQAGQNWILYAFAFYYTNEDSVKFVVHNVMADILAMEHATLDHNQVLALNSINRATQVKNAIDYIAGISSAAHHIF